MHLWQTMTGAARRPGQLLKRRLAGFLRPKCHPILLDTAINSRTTVRLNIFQVQAWGRSQPVAGARAFAGKREVGNPPTTSVTAAPR